MLAAAKEKGRGGVCDADSESHESESVYKPSPARREAERPAEVEGVETGEGGFLCGVLFVSEQEDCGRTSLRSEKHTAWNTNVDLVLRDVYIRDVTVRLCEN